MSETTPGDHRYLQVARALRKDIVDGIGGADSRKGSGLIGLKDRVEALGGHVEMVSPPGRGTSLQIMIPASAP